jgi:hypothetical protein
MNKFLKTIWVFFTVSVYLIVSQFIFKAVATTTIEPIDSEIGTVCHDKKFTTLDSKLTCWKWSFTTQAGAEALLVETSLLEYVQLLPKQLVTFVFVESKPPCVNSIPDPPDSMLSRVKKYNYVWVVKLTI